MADIILVDFTGQPAARILRFQKIMHRFVKDQLDPGDDQADPIVPPEDETDITAAQCQTYFNKKLNKDWEKQSMQEHQDTHTPVDF